MPNDKHRREKKREEKRKELAKAKLRADRITADVDEKDVECWLVDAWEREGWYDLNVLRRLPSGRTVLGVIGINDGACACGESDLIKDADPAGFKANFLPATREKHEVRRVPLKEARELASGALEWTKRHGFRVPAEFLEACTALGALDDALPDYDGFSSVFDGSLADLRAAIPHGTTVASMLRRPDVDYRFVPDLSADVADEDFDAQAVADAWKRSPVLTLNEADELRACAQTYARAAWTQALEPFEDDESLASPDTPADEEEKADRLVYYYSSFENAVIESIDPDRAEALRPLMRKAMGVLLEEFKAARRTAFETPSGDSRPEAD